VMRKLYDMERKEGLALSLLVGGLGKTGGARLCLTCNCLHDSSCGGVWLFLLLP
jgi:hypothetical protein